jgi:hypothetical protein
MADKHPKKTWKSPQVQLSQAIEDWSSITEVVKTEGKVAPDEKMRKDIEGLLLDLKSKLDELSSPAEPTVETAPQQEI